MNLKSGFKQNQNILKLTNGNLKFQTCSSSIHFSTLNLGENQSQKKASAKVANALNVI